MLLKKHMLRGPHTDLSPCLKKFKSKCNKSFPKKFQGKTIFQENGYPLYKLEDNRSDSHTYLAKIIMNLCQWIIQW